MENKTIQFSDETGRIILPKAVRDILNWEEKTTVEIWLNAADDSVIIKRHAFACILCGATDNLKKVREQYVCRSCQREIANG